MGYHHQFGTCFEGFKNAARDFGEYFKDMAGEAGWNEQGNPFEQAWSARAERPFADYFYPRVNVSTTEDKSLVFEFMLAGFDENSISLSFKGDKMILKARLSAGGEDQGQRRYQFRRFSLKDIDYREYPVPADRYDQDRVRAGFKNGILTVTIPQREGSPETEGIKVEIKREGN